MKRNRLLNIAIIVCKLINVFYILLFVLLTTLFILFQVDKEYYAKKLENNKTSFNYQTNGIHFTKTTAWKLANVGKDENVYSLNEITKVSLYMLYFQCVIALLFLSLSTKEFKKIMLSVKNFKTFKIENATSFRRIGKYLFGFFIVTSYASISFERGGFSRFYISITPLVFILFAFIMAEIFKEGNVLEEENDLTI